MKPLNIKSVKIKNLIEIIENPTYEDLLYEIVLFLDNEKRYDGEFKLATANYRFRTKISSNMEDDLNELVKRGYLEKLKYSNYKVLKHLWEI